MFAIIQTGGKQYRVQRGDVIDVERVAVDDKGKKVEKVTFDTVLMVHGDGGVTMGAPGLLGASVSGVVLHELRTPKVLIFQEEEAQGFRRKTGTGRICCGCVSRTFLSRPSRASLRNNKKEAPPVTAAIQRAVGWA